MIDAAWSGRVGAISTRSPDACSRQVAPRPCRRRARRPTSRGRRSCGRAAARARARRRRTAGRGRRARALAGVRERHARLHEVSVLPVPPFGPSTQMTRRAPSAPRSLRCAARPPSGARSVSAPRLLAASRTMSSAPDSKTWRTRPLDGPRRDDDRPVGALARGLGDQPQRPVRPCRRTRSGARRRRRAPRRRSSRRGCRDLDDGSRRAGPTAHLLARRARGSSATGVRIGPVTGLHLLQMA